MVIEDINKEVEVIEKAKNNITLNLQKFIVILYKIAAKDYQREVVDTYMRVLDKTDKEKWISDRYNYYLSKEFIK